MSSGAARRREVTRDMSNVLLNILFCFTVTLAYTQTIPIGIILDSKEEDVSALLRRLIDMHNDNNISGNRIIITPSWYLTDMDNNCDLIRAICQLLDAGVFMLLGSSSSRSYNIIQSYSHALNVPYVVYSRTTNHDRDGYDFDISISPSYVAAIVDIIKFFNWEKVYYVFDTDDALWELQRLHDSFGYPNQDIIVDARRIRNITSAHDFLRHLDRFSTPPGIKRIILNLSNKEAYQVVLNQIVDVGMNRDNYHYLLSGPYIDTLDLRSFLYGGVNVTGFRLPIDLAEVTSFYPRARESIMEPYTATKVSTDAALAGDGLRLVQHALNELLQSLDTRYIFKTFRHSELYNNGTRGVQCWRHPPVPWVHGPIIRETILKTKLSGMTGPLNFDRHGVRVDYKLDLLQLGYRTPLRNVGTWSHRTGVQTNMTRPTPTNMSLDMNRTRVVTTILENPFVMERCPTDGTPCHGNSRFEGYCIDLLEQVAHIVKFDYLIKLVDDNNYGTIVMDKTWNGLIGELLTHKADIAIAALTITEVRERFVDFSKPFMQLGTSIMIKKPDKEKAGVFSFKNPLSDGVWLAIIFGFLGVSLVLFFVGRFSPYEWASEAGQPLDHAKPAFSLANTVWFSLGALMQQGSDIYPRSISGRIVGSAWWFFTLIMISSYTANLAAFLTIERMEVPIDSTDDLARQSEIRYGIIANGSTQEFFKVSNVTVYKKMWNFMNDARPSVFVPTTQEGIDKVRESKGKYAFLLDSSFNEYHNQRKPCNTLKVGRNLDVKGYGIATPRGSTLRADINIAVLHLSEIGELLKLYQKWWYDKGQCASESGKDSTTSALSLSNVSGVFHILIGGLIVAMLTAFFDYIIKSKIRRRNKIKVVLKTSGSQQDMGNHSRTPRQRQRRPSDENGDCQYATLESSLTNEMQYHPCRHMDEAL